MKPFNVIYAYNGCDLDKVFFTQQLIIYNTGNCCVISCEDEPNVSNLNWYYIGKNANYIDFWNKLLKLFNIEKSFNMIVQIQGGLDFNDWKKFFKELYRSFNNFQWGIYSPFVVKSDLYPPMEFIEHPGGYRSMENSDNIIWALHKNLISNCVNEFNYDEDIVEYFNSTCRNNGYLILLDYNVYIDSHIEKIQYNKISNRSILNRLHFNEDLIYKIYEDYFLHNKSFNDIISEIYNIVGYHDKFSSLEITLFNKLNEILKDNKLLYEEFIERYYPICHYNYKPQKSDLLIVTSLSSKDCHEISQHRSLNTWVKTGLDICTVNSDNEIALLKNKYRQINIWERHEDNDAPCIQSLLDISIKHNRPILLINSDIEIFLHSDLELVPSIGIRNNYESHYNKATLESHGIDAFILTPEIINKLCYQFLKIGNPFWDWAMTFDIIGLSDIKQITDPIFFHKNHTLNWNSAMCKKNMDDLIASNPKYNIDWNNFRFKIGYSDTIKKGLY